MGPHVPEESPEISILWTKGKRMESSPKLVSRNGSINSSISGTLTPRKVALSYNTRSNKGKIGEKAPRNAGATSENTGANGVDVSSENVGANSVDVSSESGGGVCLVREFLDVENTGANSVDVSSESGGGVGVVRNLLDVENTGANSVDVSPESCGGVGGVREFLDVENTDAESMKSPTSSSSDAAELGLKTQVMETLITSMFSTISTLRCAYMQLQSAHVPYDPDKLQIADKAVIAELKYLSELKHFYKKRVASISCAKVQEHPEFPQEANVEKEDVILKSYEGIMSNFHPEIQKKNALVENLKDMLSQTTLRKEKLERRVKRLEQRLARGPLANSVPDLVPTPQILEHIVLGASEASRSFTKLLTSLMKVARWDLEAAANSIEPGMTYTRRTHKKFAFESYVNHRMLNGFESENFCVTGNPYTVMDPEKKNSHECFKEFRELRLADPLEVVTANPQGIFAKYCSKKFLDVVHPQMEESFFGNLEHRKQVLAGCHPTSQFYQSFLKLAKAMWLLHRLAFSFETNARIFQVQREVDFSPLYMESIVQLGEQDAKNSCATMKVGFTVMPGFRVEKIVIKCQVYLMGIPNIKSATE